MVSLPYAMVFSGSTCPNIRREKRAAADGGAPMINMNLSVKITLILGCYIVGLLTMGFVSFTDLRKTEEKIEFLELSNNLHNIILEVRRYEKNFLLYNKMEAFQENKRYLEQALETEKAIVAKAGKLKVGPMLEELEKKITTYGVYMAQLALEVSPHTTAYDQTVDILREQGKQMTELSENIDEFERNQIHALLAVIKRELVSWVSVAVVLGIVFSLLIIYYIFKPLSVIKQATEDIAQGKFNRIEVINTRDEMQQVMEAFNTMVQELEFRQDQLVQSEKLSSIGTLTAGVAHQLNNPLNNISTSCQIALDEIAEGDPQFLQRMLKNIHQETLRARDVVKGLLEFSRVQEFNLRPWALADVVDKAVRLVQSQVPADIRLFTDIPEDLVLPMDAQRMQEVFLNLFINAIQSIEGNGEITIRAVQDHKAKQAVIEIHDTGHGIPEEIQGKLFDPFYTTKEEGQGTGLGLSVVYGIVQKHRGNITVQSAPGEGSTFIIHLPLASEDRAQA